MKPVFLIYTLAISATMLLPGITSALAANSAVIQGMEEYFDFTEYEGATIMPEQIPGEHWKKIHIIDTRDAEQYQREHIPGSVNIEWRKLLGQRHKLPVNKMVLVYCNTGTLSSQAGFALRVAGMENVRILQGGFTEWKAKGGFEANSRAGRKSAVQVR